MINSTRINLQRPAERSEIGWLDNWFFSKHARATSRMRHTSQLTNAQDDLCALGQPTRFSTKPGRIGLAMLNFHSITLELLSGYLPAMLASFSRPGFVIEHTVVQPYHLRSITKQNPVPGTWSL